MAVDPPRHVTSRHSPSLHRKKSVEPKLTSNSFAPGRPRGQLRRTHTVLDAGHIDADERVRQVASIVRKYERAGADSELVSAPDDVPPEFTRESADDGR